MRDPKAGGVGVLVVGNYAPDGQESMLRFTRMLLEGLQAQGVTAEAVAPAEYFGRLRRGTSGLGKWLAYLDKYLVFPCVLRRRVRKLGQDAVIHIADHSNAMYVPAAGSIGHRVLVTCHDLGAVRGALGEDTDCPATRPGKVLQRWIAQSLGKADLVACVSTATKLDVERLIRRPDGSLPTTRLVLNGQNAPYGQLDRDLARARLPASSEGGEPFEANAPFVLNVGSSLSRKNRGGVMRTFARLKDRWAEGRLVFAGEKLTEEERNLADELGIAERLTEIVKPVHAELEALYNLATCLLFPSKFEGFGWPAIEAQACGCPVVCSDAGALGEVVGASGFVRPFTEEQAFAEEIWRVARDRNAADQWKAAGLKNVERFRTAAMIDEYRRCYNEMNRLLSIGHGVVKSPA